MKDFYTIGMISKLSKISTETLRYYDKVGLFCPKHRDEDTGYRYYTKDSLTALLIIRRLRNLGFSIEALKSALEDPSLSNLKSLLLEKSQEYEQSIKVLEARENACKIAYERIINGENLISLFKYNISSDTDIENIIEVDFLPEKNLVYSRKIMDSYINSDLSLSRWIDIYEKCTENGIEMKGSITVIYHTNPLDQFLSKDCDVEFAMEINSDDANKISKNETRKWGSFMACTSYFVGDYSKIMSRHVEMIKWINTNGYRISGPISEEFIISPLDVYNTEDYVTKIIIPIEEIK